MLATTTGLGMSRLKSLSAKIWLVPQRSDRDDHRTATGTPLVAPDPTSRPGSPPEQSNVAANTLLDTSSSQSPKHSDKEHGRSETFYIVNVQTGDYAALLSDNDRTEIVNTTDNVNPGSEWFITHLKRDEYRIQNAGLESFACYDNRPNVGAQILGKWVELDAKPSVWRVRATPGPTVNYTISPSENPDVFWMTLGKVDGTPLELGKPWAAGKCQWAFKAVGSNTKPSPIIPYGAGGHILITQVLLQKLPNMDPDSVRLAFDVATTVLNITEGIQNDLDEVERKIVSTATLLATAHNALLESNTMHSEGEQWMSQFRRTLKKELGRLYALRDESMVREAPDYEDDQDRVSEIFEHVNEARMQFELAVGIRTFKSLYEMEGSVRKSFLKDLKPSKIADHKYYLEGKEERLLHRTVCTLGTRVRILDNIINWVTNPSPDGQNVYWLFGPAGSGKSTIAYTIARRFEFTGDVGGMVILGGNFFCSRQFEETEQARWIVRTIAYHLTLVCKPFADALSCCSGASDRINQDIKTQIKHLLVKPWQASEADRIADPSSPPHYLVVIDALDEIGGKGGSSFLRDLFEVFNKGQLRGIKLFATSRPDPELVKVVDSFAQKELYRLQDVAKEEVQYDIKTYLTSVLPYFANRAEMSRLVTLSDGLFIYAATVVRYLEGYESSEQQRLLKQLLSSQNPAIPKRSGDSPLLDKLYRQILVHAFQDLDDGILATRLQVLYTFLCTAERTSEQVIADLLRTEDGEDADVQCAAAVLRGLHAVLYIDGGQVMSYHKSFTDFLFDQTRSQEFWCDQVIQHRFLTKSCFRTMNAGLKFNIANISSSYILDCDNPEPRKAVGQNIPAVLAYSCRHWSHHLCFTDTAPADPKYGLLSEFLHIKVLFWIEAMNLLRSQGRCDSILRLAADWVGKSDPGLVGKLSEAANFAVYFSGSPATSSTPHLYISTLATWPGSSEPCVRWRGLFPRVPAFINALRGGSVLLLRVNLEAVVHAVAISNDGSRIVSSSGDDSLQVWDASTGESLKVLDGHTSTINSVAFSTDGSRIVSGSDDHSLRIWNALTGESLNVLDGHTDGNALWGGSVLLIRVNLEAAVHAVAFSIDGSWIVSGSDDKSVRVLSASTGKSLRVLHGHTSWVNSVAFSSHDSWIVSGSEDRSVRVWNALTGESLKVLDGHTSTVRSVAFSSDGSRLVSGSDDHSVRVWNALTGESLKVLDGHTSWVRSVAFSNDCGRIVSGSRDCSVRVWNALTGESLKVLDGHTDGVNSVAFSNDGSRIVSGSSDDSLRVWNASTGESHKVLDGHADGVNSVAFSNDGSRIVSGSDDNSVQVWNAFTGESLKVLDGHVSVVNSVAFSTDGSRIVSGSDDLSVQVWNASTGESLKVLYGHTKPVNSVAFSIDGSQIVSGSNDHSVRIWNASTGKSLKVLDGHTFMVTSVAFSTDGSRITSGSWDHSVRVWNALTGRSVKVLDGHTSVVRSVAFSNDGSRIVSGSEDHSVRVWNALTGESLKVLDGHTSTVNSVAFSTDGSRIVSGSDDHSVRVWNASTGESLKVLDGHTYSVRSVAFSNDGNRIVSGSDDHSVRVWNALTGESLEVLDVHTGEVNSVAFSTHDSSIISGSEDKSVQMWDTSMIPRYLREYIHSDGNRIYTGWIFSPSGEDRLMFVPPDTKLPDSTNILSIPPSAASSVDFMHAALGLEWRNCYQP